jgi:K+-sensing histidine kinase KdpD
VVEELVRYSEQRNVTELVLGARRGRAGCRSVRRSTADRVIARSTSFDVRVVSATADQRRPPPASAGRRELRPKAYALAAGLVATAGRGRGDAHEGDAARRPGDALPHRRPLQRRARRARSLDFASVLGLLVYDFFFVEPC